MRHALRAALTLGIAFTIAAPAASQSTGAPCEGFAFVIDPDPRGVTVRAAPDAKAGIVATLPKDKEDTLVRFAAEAVGWFRIIEAFRFSDGRTTKPVGWVHGSRLGIGAREMDISDKGALVLRAEPREGAAVVATLSWELRDGKVTISETRWGRRRKRSASGLSPSCSPRAAATG